MENFKLALQIAILAALIFAGYKLYNAFGSLEQAEKDIKSAIAKIDSADAKIVKTQALMSRLDSMVVSTQIFAAAKRLEKNQTRRQIEQTKSVNTLTINVLTLFLFLILNYQIATRLAGSRHIFAPSFMPNAS